MLNQAILVGRIFAIEDGAITIKIPRNEEKEDVDIITARVEGEINTSIQKYCHVGDVVGIKGKMRTDENGMYLKADKVSFLTSKVEED